MNERTDPSPVGDVIDLVMAEVAGGRVSAHLEVGDALEQVLPPGLRGRVRPLGVEGGGLVLEAADGPTASLLRFEKQRLLEAVGALLPHLGLNSVTVRVSSTGSRDRPP